MYPNLQQPQQQVPQQHQQYQYQQPPPMQSPHMQAQQQHPVFANETQPLNVHPQQQASRAGRCPFSRLGHCQCRFRTRLMRNPEKKQVIALILSLALASILAVFSTGFGFIVALIPKCMAFALGFSAIKQKKTELAHGIFFGFQMFSMLFTLALGFNGLCSFVLAMFVLVGEAMTLVYAGKMACNLARERENRESAPVEDQQTGTDDDVMDAQQVAPEQPQAVYEHVYPQQPVNYTNIYQQQAPEAQPQLENGDEALFQKYATQLNLLAEMNFAQTYSQKVRNAHLLEKHQGNIQATVADLCRE
mmetsp:Transcript_7046/g.26417  ORF Transcript_7046/g.26417 Transcript_7046/m.26417 type:complete len:304 (-) Transcript_7046:154-1065(-)|eukprot:CAMPEP_0117437568 /NCGR_PEP_ID=MMETSP0759-20121206/1590_1 /TAXON_ID=63605 /ORGANISM="Percolomonas cosmopolitus, Strain WS" /LENGTH=303 /DNA_ID=CAMNT_0005229203 /DNA_START=725 /DNA_END=1636 /DNA_ORIENTATION=+